MRRDDREGDEHDSWMDEPPLTPRPVSPDEHAAIARRVESYLAALNLRGRIERELQAAQPKRRERLLVRSVRMSPAPLPPLDFPAALALLLPIEGGTARDPRDHGGLTARGVTQDAYDRFRSDIGQPRQPVTAMTDAELVAFYRAVWNRAQCDRLPSPLNWLHFDSAVQHGYGGPNPATMGAAELLQRALGVAEDGVIGPATFAAVAAVPPFYAALDLLWTRHDYYTREPAAQWDAFGRGWMNRVDDLWATLKRYRPALPLTTGVAA